MLSNTSPKIKKINFAIYLYKKTLEKSIRNIYNEIAQIQFR